MFQAKKYHNILHIKKYHNMLDIKKLSTFYANENLIFPQKYQTSK